MVNFKHSILNYHSESFNSSLKYFLESLNANTLPLNKCTTQGGIVEDEHISACILSVNDTKDSIDIKTGIFFYETVGGCSCGDEPMSVNVYCEIMVSIDKHSKDMSFSVFKD